MKKGLILITLLMVCTSIFANEFKLIEFRKLAADFHAERNSVEDMDREYCTALRVESEIPSSLGLKQKIYKKENVESGVYYFFITHKEKQVTFTSPNFQPLTVDVPKNGLKKGVVYYVKLESILDVNVTLNVTPKPDRIILNDKIIKSSKFKQPSGKYHIQIEKKGYETIDEQITINNENSYFNYILGKKSAVNKEVSADPTGLILERFGVVYEITSCEMYEDQVVLNLNITNKKDDQNLKLLVWDRNLRCRIIDDLGNEYIPQKLNFANKSKNGDIGVNLVSGISTKASLIFKNVNKGIGSISKFDLGVWTKESDSFRVTFRDIPITKK